MNSSVSQRTRLAPDIKKILKEIFLRYKLKCLREEKLLNTMYT